MTQSTRIMIIYIQRHIYNLININLINKITIFVCFIYIVVEKLNDVMILIGTLEVFLNYFNKITIDFLL